MIVDVVDNTNGKFKIQVKENDGKISIHIEEPEQKIRLRYLKEGEIFRGENGSEFIVCEHLAGWTYVVTKDALNKKMPFGKDNNWVNSEWRKYLNSEYFQEICDEFGKENINEHEVDLTSMDGYDDYGTVRDKISAMTFDRYRKYHKYIGDVPEWNYFSTPDSTPSGYGASNVRCARNGSSVNCTDCGYDGALRPFFILNSSVQVYKVNKK